jgi:hypothetical protein
VSRVEVFGKLDLERHRLPVSGVGDEQINAGVLGRKPNMPVGKRALNVLPN